MSQFRPGTSADHVSRTGLEDPRIKRFNDSLADSSNIANAGLRFLSEDTRAETVLQRLQVCCAVVQELSPALKKGLENIIQGHGRLYQLQFTAEQQTLFTQIRNTLNDLAQLLWMVQSSGNSNLNQHPNAS